MHKSELNNVDMRNGPNYYILKSSWYLRWEDVRPDQNTFYYNKMVPLDEVK